MPQLLPSNASQTFAVLRPSAISCGAPASVNSGASFQIVGVLSDAIGPVFIAGATVSVLTSWGPTTTAVTDVNGRYAVTVTAPSFAGSVSAFATWSGNSTYSGASSPTTNITVVAPVATSLSLVLNPTSIGPGGTVVASGTLTRADGVLAAGLTIVITLDGSTSGLTAPVTDQSGNYLINIIAPSTAGTHTVGASFAGATVALSVLSPSGASMNFGTTPYLAAAPVVPVIAAVSLLAGVGLVLLARKRR